jgi:hypothetical protein
MGRREAWRDEEGSLFAHGYRSGSSHWLEVPGVGVFRFDLGGPSIVAVPEPGVPRESIVDSYRRLILPNALQALGHEVLHASGVLAPQGVVALCARRRTGKSTTAYGLGRRGYGLWADDAVALEIAGRSVLSPRLPFAMRLRPDTASFFESNRETPGDSIDRPESAPLAIVCALEQTSGPGNASVEIQQLAPREAFLALLENCYWFSMADPERKRAMMSRYLDVSALVPVVRLRFTAGLEKLDKILDLVEDVLGDLETPA